MGRRLYESCCCFGDNLSFLSSYVHIFLPNLNVPNFLTKVSLFFPLCTGTHVLLQSGQPSAAISLNAVSAPFHSLSFWIPHNLYLQPIMLSPVCSLLHFLSLYRLCSVLAEFLNTTFLITNFFQLR